MPTRDDAPVGAPCWFDLGTTDKAKSKAFYGELFGWTADEAEDFGGYINFAKDGVGVCGGMQNEGPDATDGWSIYLATPDIEKVAEATVTHGGSVAAPPMPVGDLGQMAFVLDPGGAFIGAWQPGMHKGFGVFGEPGTGGWFELHTREWEASLAFYRDVYGSTIEIVSDTPEFRYAMIMGDGEGVAGIMDASQWLPEGVPAHWSVYFTVESADATVAKAIELGATLVDGPDDTPYGRLVTMTDTNGARFKLVQNP